MKMQLRVGLAVLLLVASRERLPAPISEIATPTPSPQESPSPQLRPGEKWKPQAEQGKQSSAKESPAATPNSQTAARFAGTWSGKITFGTSGVVELTLIVNSSATSLIQKSKTFGEHSHATTYTAGTLSWKGGRNDGFSFTLAPNADGLTAVVTSKPKSGRTSTGTFKRVKPGQAPANSATPRKRKLHPGTKTKRRPGR
jgi:hypothetical protein